MDIADNQASTVFHILYKTKKNIVKEINNFVLCNKNYRVFIETYF